MCLRLVAIILLSKPKSSAGESSTPRPYQSRAIWTDANTRFLSICLMLIVPLVISAGHSHNFLLGFLLVFPHPAVPIHAFSIPVLVYLLHSSASRATNLVQNVILMTITMSWSGKPAA